MAVAVQAADTAMAVASTAVAAEAVRRGYTASAAVWRRARRSWSERRLCGLRRKKSAVAGTTGRPSILPVAWQRWQPDSRLCRSWSKRRLPLRSKSTGDIWDCPVSRSPIKRLRRASTDGAASSHATSDVSVTKLRRRFSRTHEEADVSSDSKRRKLNHLDAGKCTPAPKCIEQRRRRLPSWAMEEEDSPTKRACSTSSLATLAAAAAAAAANAAAAAAAAATMAAAAEKERCCGCGRNSQDRRGNHVDHREGLKKVRGELVDGEPLARKRLRRAGCIDERSWDPAANRQAFLRDLRERYPALAAQPILEEAASESADMGTALEKVISWLSRRLEPQLQCQSCRGNSPV